MSKLGDHVAIVLRAMRDDAECPPVTDDLVIGGLREIARLIILHQNDTLHPLVRAVRGHRFDERIRKTLRSDARFTMKDNQWTLTAFVSSKPTSPESKPG